MRDINQKLFLHEHLKFVRHIHLQTLITNRPIIKSFAILSFVIYWTYLAENLRSGSFDYNDSVTEVIAQAVFVRLLTPIMHVEDHVSKCLLAKFLFRTKCHKDGLFHLAGIAVFIHYFYTGATRYRSLYNHVKVLV